MPEAIATTAGQLTLGTPTIPGMFSEQSAPPIVRRPSDYNPSLTTALGPGQPYRNLNRAAIGLPPSSAGGLEGSDCIFVGGFPCYFTEAQIQEVLESFGPLRCFDLVKDPYTGNSKGHFCVYQDPSVTDIACAALDGIKMGDKLLVIRRAYQDDCQHTLKQQNIQAQQQLALERRLIQMRARM